MNNVRQNGQFSALNHYLKPLTTREILLKMIRYEFESDFRQMMIFLVINDL